jgi:diguanylate cyclase (GGDEF)-like protein
MHARRHREARRDRRAIRKGRRLKAHIAGVALPSLGRATPTAFGLLAAPGLVLSGATPEPGSVGKLQTLVPSGPVRAGIRHRSTAAARVKPTNPATRLPASAPASVIDRFVGVVPGAVWLALAAALALAASAAAGAVAASRRARRSAARYATVSAQALTDPLTGVLNRRGFLVAAERELARSRRYQRPFALAYVDVRGLKAVNDSEGHLAGDELLRQAAGLLSESARGDDVVGRIGGDELAVLLAEQSTDGAEAVAGRIHEQVAARRASLRLREPWDLTIGTAAYPGDGATIEQLLAAADRRLYQQRGIELR